MYRYIDLMFSSLLAFAEDPEKEAPMFDWETVREFLSLCRRDISTGTWNVDIAKFAAKYGPLLVKGRRIEAPGGFRTTYDKGVEPGTELLIESLDDWLFHINCLRDMVVLQSINNSKDWHNITTLPAIEDNMKVFLDKNGDLVALYHGTLGNVERLRDKHLFDDLPDNVAQWLKCIKVPFFYTAPFEEEDTSANRMNWIKENPINEAFYDYYFGQQVMPNEGVLQWVQSVVADMLCRRDNVIFCNLCGEVVTSSDGKNSSRITHSCRMNYYRKENEYVEIIGEKRNCDSDQAKELLRIRNQRKSVYSFDDAFFLRGYNHSLDSGPRGPE